jgi:hypothetical protein
MLPRAAWLSLLPPLLLGACRFPMPEPSALEGSADGAPDGWSWHTDKLAFPNTIHGIAGERDDLWAVGNGGLIAHHDGKGWTRHTSPTAEDLQAIWGASPSDLWAVGMGGVILRYSGGAWTQVASPVQAALHGVWGSGAADIWAVGAAGTVLHFDGSSWSSSTEGADDLRGVHGTSADDVWAVGGDGALLHRQGGSWKTAQGGTTRTVYGVWARASQEAWAVVAGGSVLRHDGSSWSKEDLDTGVNFRAVTGRTAASGVEVWAVGDRDRDGVIYELKGGSWQAAAGAFAGTVLKAVWVASSGEVWAAGGGGSEAFRYGP